MYKRVHTYLIRLTTNIKQFWWENTK